MSGQPVGGPAPRRRRLRPEEVPDLWSRVDMRAALAQRDIAAVYRILQRYGWSQRRIAAATGQSQSEISEVMAGRRIVSYDVLLRIAEGLGVPRGWLGLAYVADPLPTDPPDQPVMPSARPRVRLGISIDIDDDMDWPGALRSALATIERTR